MNIPGYDAWRLAGPDDDRNEVGTEEGETCGRYQEVDGDAPKGTKAKPCNGEMIQRQEGAEHFETRWIECDTCGEIL